MQANYDRESHIPQGHWDGGRWEIRNDRMDEKTPADRAATTVMYGEEHKYQDSLNYNS